MPKNLEMQTDNLGSIVTEDFFAEFMLSEYCLKGFNYFCKIYIKRFEDFCLISDVHKNISFLFRFYIFLSVMVRGLEYLFFINEINPQMKTYHSNQM